MSGRSRGRGGWGKGRGRGGGGTLEIRDEDGNYVTKDLAAPPPLFPDLTAQGAPARLPRRQERKPEEDAVKAEWQACQSSWRRSPLFLQLPPPMSSGMKRSLEDFVVGTSSKISIDTRQVFKVVTLSTTVLPKDLISVQDRRVSERAAPDAFFTSVNKSEDKGVPDDFLKRLNEMKENPDDKGKKKEEDDKEDEDQAEEDEMDELNESEMEDDDYMQGNEYDDDEGYDDDLDGGGDDEPVF